MTYGFSGRRSASAGIFPALASSVSFGDSANFAGVGIGFVSEPFALVSGLAPGSLFDEELVPGEQAASAAKPAAAAEVRSKSRRVKPGIRSLNKLLMQHSLFPATLPHGETDADRK
ncbi:hypothetical protein GCM10027569_36040 [Flindersiella endophytica]